MSHITHYEAISIVYSRIENHQKFPSGTLLTSSKEKLEIMIEDMIVLASGASQEEHIKYSSAFFDSQIFRNKKYTGINSAAHA